MHTHHGATIFAHDNVRVRLANDDKVKPEALPLVTYQDGVKFHFNGDTIHVIHLPGGHTDGDSVVKFEKATCCMLVICFSMAYFLMLIWVPVGM